MAGRFPDPCVGGFVMGWQGTEKPRWGCGETSTTSGDSSSLSSGDTSCLRPTQKRARDDTPNTRQCTVRHADETMGVGEWPSAVGSSGRTNFDETMELSLPQGSDAEATAASHRSTQSFHPFTSSFSGQTLSRPDMDVIRKADHYEVQLDLPGYRRDQVCLQLRERTLYVSVAAQPVPQHAAFSTTVRLPHDVDSQRVCADMDRGLLRLRLPRGAAEPGPVCQLTRIASYESLDPRAIRVEHLN